MAKKEENAEASAPEDKSTPENKPAADKPAADKPAADKPAADQPQQQQRLQIQLDDTGISARYANFCRVNGTPEELIIDFGLNAQPFGAPAETLRVNQRLVINYYTAKRLLAALSMSVQRHEAAFGVLETDVQKRVLPSALRQQAPPQQS
ncbi:MAG: DUF3467 domain-containing protein [Planctomycetes bacterium]|nr:DUF3467 domain-containing protein [Planctomycetota bacterium]